MNINELFEKIQDKIHPEDLCGEFQLQGNCIVWTYNLENVVEEIKSSVIDEEIEEDEIIFDFDIESTEEKLQEAYNEDFERFKEFLDEIEETDNWSFSESEIIENIISFKIF